MADKGYHNLDVYNMAHGLAVRVHKLTLTLPAFEKYDEPPEISAFEDTHTEVSAPKSEIRHPKSDTRNLKSEI